MPLNSIAEMQRDLKIGMVLGVVLVVAAAFWLAMRPSLSVRSRMLQSQEPQDESARQPTSEQTLRPELSPAGPNLYDSSLTVKSRPAFADNQKIHTVLEGQTLSDISRIYYGSPNKWQKILEANQLKNPNKIKPGDRLIIPE
jgi:nucleoid-associated protein YgaU